MIRFFEIHEKISSIANLFQINDIEEHAIPTTPDLLPYLENNSCLLLEGDNYISLSKVSEELHGRIDFCYIDPPYNTGQDFIYSDKKNSTASSLWGSHHAWLAFMLPRLVMAREALSQDGVIAISIDDYEYAHLKILLDHIFGPNQYVGTLAICRSNNGKGSKPNIAVNHEYVLIYSKTENGILRGLPEPVDKEYAKIDEYGEFNTDGLFRKKGDASLRTDRPNMYYPLYYSEDGKVYAEEVPGLDLKCVYPIDSKGVERRWLWGKDKAAKESWKLYASKGGVIYVKNYKTAEKRVKIRSFLSDLGYLTDKATTEIKERFGEKIFETPKPLKLIMDLIDCCTNNNALILDFFAGSGTTAEAAHRLNKIDGGKRKIILAESTQPIVGKHIASAHGYNVIADITARRLELINRDDSSFQFSRLRYSLNDPIQIPLL